jgi:hypothetical protein
MLYLSIFYLERVSDAMETCGTTELSDHPTAGILELILFISVKLYAGSSFLSASWKHLY